MLNRKQLFWIIGVTFLFGYMINLYIPIPILWMLLILPAIGMVLVCPNWITSVYTGIVILLTMFLTEFTLHEWRMSYDDAVTLLLVGIVGSILFISMTFALLKIKQQMMTYKTLAYTDPLTNIYNRRYLERYMKKIASSQDINAYPMTLLIFDIDHFKKVNDSYGHHTGDLILKNIVHVVKSMIKESDIFVRLGGEEFVIILTHCSLKEGTNLANDIRKKIKHTQFKYKETPIPITISIGLTSFHKQSDSQILENADQALYRAKKAGRDQVVSC